MRQCQCAGIHKLRVPWMYRCASVSVCGYSQVEGTLDVPFPAAGHFPLRHRLWSDETQDLHYRLTTTECY